MKTDFTPRLQYTGLIAGAAVGVATLGYGIYKDSQANKKAKELQNSRPKYTDSPYTKGQFDLAQSELANGMGADAERFYKEQLDSNQSNSLDALLKGGGNVNNVAQIFNGSQEGNQRLTLMKENLRLNNIHNFMAASQNADTERQQGFQFNQYAPWADASQANAQAKQAAGQTINSGINSVASGVTGYLNNRATQRSFDNYLGQNQSDNGAGYFGGSNPSQVDYSSLNTGGYTPNVSGGSNPKPLNLDFNNSSNQSPWDIPGNS